MNKPIIAETVREEIILKTEEYYNLALATKEPFVPGVSSVPYAGRVFDKTELVNLVNAALDFWLTFGPYSEEFEAKLSQYLGLKHCLLVNSGSSANLLAFMTLTSEKLGKRRIARGDEVITIAAGFPTTIAPLIQYGAVPVFVDVQLRTANIDVSQLENAISKRTKAVFLAHTLGNPFDVYSIRNFCDKHDLWLIEDNCDALGSKYDGQLTGTFGDISTSSFYAAHHLTMGEGGAVYTDNARLAKIAASLRDWGRDCSCPPGQDDTCGKRFDRKMGELPLGYDHKYIYSHFGYNLKATDLQAAIGNAQLDKISAFTAARRLNYQYLYDGLKNLEDLIVLPEATQNSEPSWFCFLMTVKPNNKINRADIVKFLEARKIQTRMLFAGNFIKHPCFDGMRHSGAGYRVVGELSQTDIIMDNAFWVGLYPGLSHEMLDYIISSVQEAFATYG